MDMLVSPKPPGGQSARVLMVTDVYFPRVNGVSTSIQTFRKALADRGYDVTVVCPRYGDEPPEEGIVRVASRVVPLDPEDRMLAWGELVQRCDEIAVRGVDVIHIQTPFLAHYAGVKVAKRYKIPVVESYHTFFEEYLHHYVKFAPKAAMRFLARRFSASQCNQVNGLVVPSQAMLNVLRDYGVTTKAEVVPTGIDLDQFNSGDGSRFREQHGIPPRRPVMLYVGRVVYEKNIEFLLHVTQKVRESNPDALLVIAGEGPAAAGLEKLAISLGLRDNVMFVGYLDRTGPLMDCYCAADVFVFASRTETQGLVLLEAMALGVPVVSTAVMGTKEILENARGCVIASENVEAFAQSVLGVLGDAALRERLGKEARDYSRQWAEDAFAERMDAFYRQVIEEQCGRSCHSMPAT